MQAKQAPSVSSRKLEILNNKMTQFKKRFTEQRVRTKQNQIDEARHRKELMQYCEQLNYMEKEIQSLEKQDEN